MKTNATRLLDRLGVAHELREYDVDPQDLSAESVAAKIGLPARQVFKTLLVIAPTRDAYFAVVPGDRELDLKELARQTGERRLELCRMDDLPRLTGYIRGGVTVLAAKKEYPVYLDESALQFELISVSAGVRGTQILLNPKEYARITKAISGHFSHVKA